MRWKKIRIHAVQRVEAGESPEDVVRVLGFTRTVIYDWLAKYWEGGIDGLGAKTIPGRLPRLDGKQLRWLYKALTLKNPLQFKSLGRLLKKLGLTPQKSLRRAYEQNLK